MRYRIAVDRKRLESNKRYRDKRYHQPPIVQKFLDSGVVRYHHYHRCPPCADVRVVFDQDQPWSVDDQEFTVWIEVDDAVHTS